MNFVFPLCIFSLTVLLMLLRVFICDSICCGVFVRRATSSANLRSVRVSPSIPIPSVSSAFLNISSFAAVNSFYTPTNMKA